MEHAKILDESEREVFLCDICDAKSMVDTILFHHSMEVCIQCKKRIDLLPKARVENVARFFDGNVL